MSISSKGHPKVVLVVLWAAILVILGLPVGVGADPPGQTPENTCEFGYYYELAANLDWDAGVKGWNQVRNVSTVYQSWQARSVWVKHDDRNWVETGWFFGEEGVPRYFIAWKKNNVYNDQELSYAPAGTYHWFTAINPTGNVWEFWMDNTNWLWTLNDMTFNVGLPGAMSEAHNTCDQAGTTFWSLQKYIRSWNSWRPWTKKSPNYQNPQTNPWYYIDSSGQWGAPDVLRVSPCAWINCTWSSVEE